MNINFSSFKEGSIETISYSPDIDDFNKLNHSLIISKINSIEGNITFSKVNDILMMNFDLNFNVCVISGYTLKEFDKTLNIRDTLYFTNDENSETEEVFYTKDIINLDEIVYSLLITSIPLNIHADDESLPSGDDFKVYSEDELEKEIEEDSSPFDVLKDLDL